MPRDITPEQKLDSLKLMLRLRAIGDDGIAQCEKMRSKLRTTLLLGESDEAASEEVSTIIKQYLKKLEKLDGSYEVKRARKRARKEARLAAATSTNLLDNEAGSGEDSEAEDGEDAGEN